MSKDKEKNKMQMTLEFYAEKYNKAYFKLAKFEENDMFFNDVLYTNINMQDKYTSRDVRNIFITNTFDKNKAIAFDKNLPDEIDLTQYYYNFEDLSDNYFEKNEIFKNKEQLKNFSKTFLSRFFHDMSEYSFFDKIVLNTLIKSKLMIRHDSAEEPIENVFKAFNFY